MIMCGCNSAVECYVANVVVAGSNPVTRSIINVDDDIIDAEYEEVGPV